MGLFSRPKPRWEEEVSFSDRRRPRHLITETTVRRSRRPSTASTYVASHHEVETISPPPQEPTPSPPPPEPTPSPPPPPSPSVAARVPSPPPQPISRIELVSVEEDIIQPPVSSYAPTSRTSHNHKTRRSHSQSRSRGGDEIYIERERIKERVPRAPSPMREDYDTYRYVEGPKRNRSRSITYENGVGGRTNRVVERERVVVEDEGRRREFYRRV